MKGLQIAYFKIGKEKTCINCFTRKVLKYSDSSPIFHFVNEGFIFINFTSEIVHLYMDSFGSFLCFQQYSPLIMLPLV